MKYGEPGPLEIVPELRIGVLGKLAHKPHIRLLFTVMYMLLRNGKDSSECDEIHINPWKGLFIPLFEGSNACWM